MHIVLVEPKIPSNTGNLIRLAANIGVSLHLIHPLGFDLENTNLRRAGLDYSDLSEVHEHKEFSDYVNKFPGRRLIFFTVKGNIRYSDISYTNSDSLVFGSEDTGLSDLLLEQYNQDIKSYIPMMPHNRSINLSNAVAITSFEAWRQLRFVDSSNETENNYFG
ncbi:MAG: tRNA (uridine(34)/cytosine(34)/5-carboxymethylaminomethyluridine(34)-2'-O)-methyltransferase TrmL [Chloroflexi bacterium]|nr:tRNA (uridine(34)/cytosine(34)/5-carboxymethylaminomethyluridine(34)-2'-O)-methyltransferase TrmL [Chloroflexota bacterium]